MSKLEDKVVPGDWIIHDGPPVKQFDDSVDDGGFGGLFSVQRPTNEDTLELDRRAVLLLWMRRNRFTVYDPVTGRAVVSDRRRWPDLEVADDSEVAITWQDARRTRLRAAAYGRANMLQKRSFPVEITDEEYAICSDRSRLPELLVRLRDGGFVDVPVDKTPLDIKDKDDRPGGHMIFRMM